jgi:hypothetical protein
MGNCTHFLGVDPGKKGAFAILSTNGDLTTLLDMPTNRNQPCPYGIGTLYIALRQKYQNTFTVIEKPHSRPTDGRVGVATYHLGAGYLVTPPIVFSWPTTLLHPRIWTKTMHLGLPADLSAKQKSWQAFQALMPKLARSDAFVNNRGRPMDGRVDAVLIAEYARRMYQGKVNIEDTKE